MSEHLRVLLVHGSPETFDSLKSRLGELSVETVSAGSCQRAQELIVQGKPHVVFTDRTLPDGSWMNILSMCKAANIPANVIVVASVPDVRFYVSVMEKGAFDFVAPPFERDALKFVVRSAALDALQRRDAAGLFERSQGSA